MVETCRSYRTRWWLQGDHKCRLENLHGKGRSVLNRKALATRGRNLSQVWDKWLLKSEGPAELFGCEGGRLVGFEVAEIFEAANAAKKLT